MGRAGGLTGRPGEVDGRKRHVLFLSGDNWLHLHFSIAAHRAWDVLDWEFIAQVIRESYRMTAPKRLVTRLDVG